jgi:hypothetical protein
MGMAIIPNVKHDLLTSDHIPKEKQVALVITRYQFAFRLGFTLGPGRTCHPKHRFVPSTTCLGGRSFGFGMFFANCIAWQLAWYGVDETLHASANALTDHKRYNIHIYTYLYISNHIYTYLIYAYLYIT